MDRTIREIDDHYRRLHLSQDANQIAVADWYIHGAVTRAAAANIAALARVSQQLAESNSFLDELAATAQRHAEILSASRDAIVQQTDILGGWLQKVVEALQEDHKTLASIADTLAAPNDAEVKELLREAEKAVEATTITEGKEQEAEFADASRLLDEILINPIGSRNYVAWFQMGWVKWKHDNDLAGAEEAFFTSARLSREARDLYHVNALRHLAHMQYLQGRYEDAFSSINRALTIAPDVYEVVYDAARYAARTGRTEMAAELLNKCIDMRPHTIIDMFAEEDFLQ